MCDDDDEGEWMMRDTNERWKWENDIEKIEKGKIIIKVDKRRGRWRGEVMISDDKNQHSGNIICDDDS